MTEKRLCEVGYFPDMAGYRKVYGDCPHNDIESSGATVVECAQQCDNNTDCTAFALRHEVIQHGHITCYLKDSCTNPDHVPGIFIYFKGLTETGKALRLTN